MPIQNKDLLTLAQGILKDADDVRPIDPQEAIDLARMVLEEAKTPLKLGQFPDKSGNGAYPRWDFAGKEPNVVLTATFRDGSQPTGEDGDYPVVAEVALGEPLSIAQMAYEIELRGNYGLEFGSSKFKSKVAKVRKALGFSYPSMV